MPSFAPDATRAALGRLAAPVLVHAGELDGGPCPGPARRTAEAFPDAVCVIQPGAGHCPWLDDAERFVRRIAAFRDPEPAVSSPPPEQGRAPSGGPPVCAGRPGRASYRSAAAATSRAHR